MKEIVEKIGIFVIILVIIFLLAGLKACLGIENEPSEYEQGYQKGYEDGYNQANDYDDFDDVFD